MKGLYQQFEEKVKENPPITNITKELLSSFLTDIIGASKPRERKIIFYTGGIGLKLFDFTIKYGGTIEAPHFTQQSKYLKGYYISLFKKHGNYKVHVVGRTFTFYKGTEIIRVISDVQNGFDLHTYDMNSNQVKAGINRVNAYIKTLK